jgi:hypothetical protein
MDGPVMTVLLRPRRLPVAPNAEAIREAARRLNIPADVGVSIVANASGHAFLDVRMGNAG